LQAKNLNAADLLVDHPNLAAALGDSPVVYDVETEVNNRPIPLRGADRIHNRHASVMGSAVRACSACRFDILGTLAVSKCAW
jgi:hypothetical protein